MRRSLSILRFSGATAEFGRVQRSTEELLSVAAAMPAAERLMAYQQAAKLWYGFAEDNVKGEARDNYETLCAIRFGRDNQERAEALRSDVEQDPLQAYIDEIGTDRRSTDECREVMETYDPQSNLGNLGKLLVDRGDRCAFGEIFLRQMFEDNRCHETAQILGELLDTAAPTQPPIVVGPNDFESSWVNLQTALTKPLMQARSELWSFEICSAAGMIHAFCIVKVSGLDGELEFWLVQSYFSRLCEACHYTFGDAVKMNRSGIQKSCDKVLDFLHKIRELTEMSTDMKDESEYLSLWEHLFLLPEQRFGADAQKRLLAVLHLRSWWKKRGCWLSAQQLRERN